MLRGVDRAAFATSLGLRLRSAGIEVGLTAIELFTRALAASPPDRRPAIYWAARLTLVRRREDLPTFDAVFAAVFEDAVLAVDPLARRTPRAGDRPDPTDDDRPANRPAAEAVAEDGSGLPWLRRPTVVAAQEPEDQGVAIAQPLPSTLEAVADRPFADLDPVDLALLEGWIRAALAEWPSRASRRLVTHRSGRRISLRRTMAQARRTGFEPVRLHRDRPVRKPRRLVMICDFSQSMQPYAAAYLHLMRAAAMVTHSEVFAFATSLTRLTPVLAHRSPELAIERANERVSDRFGGTRIASNLRTLLASHHGESVRGAVVIIASDGWDSDDPAELSVVMARLRRRAYRVIWMNPRAGSPGYAPLVGAMAAALPFCDAHLPARTVRELAGVLDAVTHPQVVSSRA
jgi:uncharacterized protein with von Willebrand factor type A (vWA) domain